MTRQNLFSGVWDGDDDETGTRHRVFWRPDDARMGATLYELAPGTPEGRMHMHFGAEEMFFVLSGRPCSGTSTAKRRWPPETSSSARRDGPGCTRSAIRLTSPLRSSRSVPGASPTSSPIPNTATRGSRPGSRSRATREGRRSRHHRPLRDPDREITRLSSHRSPPRCGLRWVVSQLAAMPSSPGGRPVTAPIGASVPSVPIRNSSTVPVARLDVEEVAARREVDRAGIGRRRDGAGSATAGRPRRSKRAERVAGRVRDEVEAADALDPAQRDLAVALRLRVAERSVGPTGTSSPSSRRPRRTRAGRAGERERERNRRRGRVRDGVPLRAGRPADLEDVDRAPARLGRDDQLAPVGREADLPRRASGSSAGRVGEPERAR